MALETAMRTMPASVRGACVASLFLLGAGCFELTPPVEESLTLTFSPAGAVEVAAEVTIADPAVRFTDNAAARDRIAESRRLFGSGLDSWTRRFEGLDWDRETVTWEKVKGGLVRVRRTGVLEDPARLPRFFADLPLAANYDRGEGYAELTLLPLAPGRASRAEREEMARYTGAWVAAALEHERQLADLYRYLESHPDRARACLGEMYEDCLGPTEKENLPELLPDEEARMESLGDAMGKLADFIQVKSDQARSADELARWVYDPFPGPTEVAVPGAVLEVEGFEPGAPGRFVHGPLGLWRALEKLDGSFASPDPIVPLLRHFIEEKTAPQYTLDGLVATPRRAGPVPTEAELAALLDTALAPAPRYRVRWAMARPTPDGGPETADPTAPTAPRE